MIGQWASSEIDVFVSVSFTPMTNDFWIALHQY